MKKLIFKLLREEAIYLPLLLFVIYYSRWAIYKILPAFFNAPTQTESLLIAFGIACLLLCMLFGTCSIYERMGYCIKTMLDFRNQQKLDKKKDEVS